jgi:four helix bundle protein
MELVKEVYLLTKRLPKEEQYALTSQLRRAAVSIMANLAEGFNRSSDADKAHKYTISRGECAEVEALLFITVELQYFSQTDVQHALELSQQAGRLLWGLIRSYTPADTPRPRPSPRPC